MPALILATAALLASAAAGAAAPAEPAYCALAAFQSAEIPTLDKDLKRARAFRLGKVTLAGLGVGDSSSSQVIQLADKFSDAGAAQGYCTWYVNRGNPSAQKAFNWRYVEKPKSAKVIGQYMERLAPELASSETSLLECAAEHGYVAMGCNGMKHRGPTFFGMLLAYSGCSAESSARIVNTVWGLNGVKPEVRLAIIREAREFGLAHPDQSSKLRQLLSKH